MSSRQMPPNTEILKQLNYIFMSVNSIDCVDLNLLRTNGNCSKKKKTIKN